MYCGKCGTDNPNDNKFCNKCGAPIGGQAPVTPTSKPVQMQQPVYQGYNPNMYQQPVQKSGNKGLVIALISILVAVIIALICIILFVWKPFNKDDDRSRGGSSSGSGRSSSSSTMFGGGEKKETGASSGTAYATPAPAMEATAPPSYEQVEPADLSVYGSPSDVYYIFFKGFLYNDPDSVYDCFPPFDKFDYTEVVEWCKQGEDWKYDFSYEVTSYHVYSDDELNDLIDRIYSETGYIANEIDEAAVLYTHYYLNEYDELDDETIVIKISGRWYIYDLGDIDIYI